MGILKLAEGGVSVSELCRKHGMSSTSFLQLARDVWWTGCVDGIVNEGNVGGEPEFEADVC